MSFAFGSRKGAGPIRRFQIYGERCSGTNFLIRLMEANVTSAAFTEAFGFKHWFVPEALVLPADTLGLVIAREPEAWLQSLHEKAWHQPHAPKDVSAYLRDEWSCVWDDHWLGVGEDHPQWLSEMTHERDPATGERFAGPAEMRAAKTANWGRLEERSPAFATLTYEALRAKPQAFLDALGAWDIACGPYAPIKSYKGEGNEAYVPRERPPLDEADAERLREGLGARDL